MVSLLLIISFLLHIVLLIAIYFLYQQIVQLRTNKNEEIESLESLLQNFLLEIREENELLQKKLQKETKDDININNIDNIEKSNEKFLDKRIKTIKNRENIYQINTPQKAALEKEDKIETSFEAQVFQLANEGLEIEEIAKKLNRGKTEIELLMKLQKKQ